MPRLYLPSISPEDKVALICILVIILLWVAWTVLVHTQWATKLPLFQMEEWLWRKHGISVPGVFLMMLVMIGVLYAVWLMLGQL